MNKFDFNLLFCHAWLKALIPANIVAGFVTCGVYPFNSAATSISEEPESGSGDEEVVMKMAKVMTAEMMMMMVAIISQTNSVHCFSDDLVKGMTLILTMIIISG